MLRLESVNDIDEEHEDDNDRITWYNVAQTLDKIYAITFGIIGTLITIGFMSTIQYDTDNSSLF